MRRRSIHRDHGRGVRPVHHVDSNKDRHIGGLGHMGYNQITFRGIVAGQTPQSDP